MATLEEEVEENMEDLERERTARKLKALRKYLGLNQTEFGKKLGVARSSITSFENKTNPVPDYIMVMIEKVFGIEMQYFMNNDIEADDVKELININVRVDVINSIYNLINDKISYTENISLRFLQSLEPTFADKTYKNIITH